MTDSEICGREPIRFHDKILVFSCLNGYAGATPNAVQEVNLIVSRFVSGIKTVYKPVYQLLLKKLYDPVVINMVLEKESESEGAYEW